MYIALMTVKITTSLDERGIELLEFHAQRPVFSHVLDWPEKFRRAPHYHTHCQLIFGSVGVMDVITPSGTWVVPPQRAVWMPSNVVHQIRVKSDLSFRPIYILPSVAQNLPTECCVIDISPLLRALILEASDIQPDYEVGGRDERVMTLIVDEVERLAQPLSGLHLPEPTDSRLKRISKAIQEDLSDLRGLKEWSHMVGASERTINRLFTKETGMTFGQWRTQAKLMEAIRKLSEGESVINVSIDLGYESPSAFTAMFRRELGTTPSQYFK